MTDRATDTKAIRVLTADMKATTGTNGEYDITLSFPEEDRDGEVVDAKALEWRASGRMPMDVDHGMTVVSTVGSGIPEYVGDALKLRDFRFASTMLAQDVKSLVDDEHVSKVSVAFMDAVREVDEKDGKPHIRSAELLNAAIVSIPSLRDANMVRIAKSALNKVGARNSAADIERLQAAHDVLIDLGAVCGGETKGTKAVVGSYEERTDRIRQALRVDNPGSEWLWIRATFDGEVIYEVESEDGTSATYRTTVAEDGDSFTFGTPEEVDLAEVVTPPVKSKKSTTTDPDDSAAPAAESLADVNVAMAQALAAEAEVSLL